MAGGWSADDAGRLSGESDLLSRGFEKQFTKILSDRTKKMLSQIEKTFDVDLIDHSSKIDSGLGDIKMIDAGNDDDLQESD